VEEPIGMGRRPEETGLRRHIQRTFLCSEAAMLFSDETRLKGASALGTRKSLVTVNTVWVDDLVTPGSTGLASKWESKVEMRALCSPSQDLSVGRGMWQSWVNPSFSVLSSLAAWCQRKLWPLCLATHASAASSFSL
jgi:hypothetical protein